MPNHLIAPANHATRALVSGTWYTPHASRPTLVQIQLAATGISAGEDADYSIEVRDASDVVLTGYPLREALVRSAGAVDTIDTYRTVTILVPAGFDYRVVDNSTGANTSSATAIEDTL
jgi:hypothetical protein